SSRDWSPDVCSSDLTTDVLVLENGALNPEAIGHATLENEAIFTHVINPILAEIHAQAPDLSYVSADHIDMLLQNSARDRKLVTEIGRASCRERVLRT